jgi:HlyD family secretion protein
MKKIIVIGIALVMIVLTAGAFFFLQNRNKSPQFRMDRVTKGDMRATVMATGSVSAITTVLVGTQVSGTIKILDVDFNSPVKKGQILAQIDPSTFQAQVEQARANFLLANANVEKSEAALVDAKRTMERNRLLFARNLIAKSDLDTSETNYLAALAQVSASNAQVKQAKAALDFANINLNYTKIVSPVDGIVISRNVDVGQTVAASFQTPTLFTIAQDLKEMQIDTNVDEADIGKIEVDQPVEFTVDAYPDITFHGKVSEVRIAPTTVQNVVTYVVVVRVKNPDLKLKPGMTANVSIILADKKAVLKIPNAALRFRPTDRGREVPPQKGPAVWILENRNPKRINVVTGISDGSYTELLSGDLNEGQEMIVEATGVKRNNTPPMRPGFIR